MTPLEECVGIAEDEGYVEIAEQGRAELARLSAVEAERSEFLSARDNLAELAEKFLVRAEAAEARVEALSEALGVLVMEADVPARKFDAGVYTQHVSRTAIEHARAALAALSERQEQS